ncbi:MAG: THUMP domain-containing protein [Deltaproteobacteria bacterium]|nr:THUMP domain-containing protein [Deltaproteobacteria bacterium]
MAGDSQGALVLLRLSGEVSTKARGTRRQFAARLLHNIRDALACEGLAGEALRRHDRLFVRVRDAGAAPAAAAALAHVFGLQSVSPAWRGPAASLAEVVEQGARHFAGRVAGRRFAVRARRVGGRVGRGRGHFRGREVEIALGERLRPGAARVDLGDPEVTCGVELYEGSAYFFCDSIPGPGGLPLGSGGRAAALVSGGFDSPVAAWQLARRGIELEYIFCNLGGFGHRLGALRVVHALARAWNYGARPVLHAIDFGEVSRELQAKTEPRYWQVILKRQMLRAAEAVAAETGARAIATGEALGQVSSQTLANLQTIGAACELPILRPLVGANKDEIIALANRIGTGPLSAVVDEYCALVPRRPTTAARRAIIEDQEAELDPALLARAVAARERLDLRSVDPEETGLPEIETCAVPPGAVVLDLRSRPEFERWHYPGALQLDFARALDAHSAFATGRSYLLYCEFGLKSAHLAERMQQRGLHALHFRGGARALRRYAEAESAKR